MVQCKAKGNTFCSFYTTSIAVNKCKKFLKQLNTVGIVVSQNFVKQLALGV